MKKVEYRPTPAAILYREKLLLRKRSDLPNNVVSLPSAQLKVSMAHDSPETRKAFTKGMIQLFASAIVENASGSSDAWACVSLVRLRVKEGQFEFLIMCPPPPLAQKMLNRMERFNRKDRDVTDNIANLQIEYQFGVPFDTFVPVVFSYKPSEQHLLVMNKNHLTNPKQFFDPSSADCTSGFLNFIGALFMAAEDDPEKEFVADIVAASEHARTTKLDEWLRWFYCLVDTRNAFEQKRLLIDPRNPEVFYYDYAPASPEASNQG